MLISLVFFIDDALIFLIYSLPSSTASFSFNQTLIASSNLKPLLAANLSILSNHTSVASSKDIFRFATIFLIQYSCFLHSSHLAASAATCAVAAAVSASALPVGDAGSSSSAFRGRQQARSCPSGSHLAPSSISSSRCSASLSLPSPSPSQSQSQSQSQLQSLLALALSRGLTESSVCRRSSGKGR